MAKLMSRTQASVVNRIARGVSANTTSRATYVAAVASAITGYATVKSNTRVMKTALRLARASY